MPALGAANDIYRVRTSTQNLIQEALELLGVLGEGETLSADQLSNALRTLNYMVDAWNAEQLNIWTLVRTPLTLTANTNPHAIGPGSAVLDAPRPLRLWQGMAFLTGGSLGSTERELTIQTQQQFERCYDSSLAGIPEAIYYEASVPEGNLWTDVKPDDAYTLVLYLEKMLHQVFSSGTTSDLDLPPGYAQALASNLAIELAAKYGKNAATSLIITAQTSKAAIKRLNHRPLYLDIDPDLTVYRGYSLSDLRAGR
jgi:hypothetical protein